MNVRWGLMFLIIAGLSGCASELALLPGADQAAQNYVECRKKASGIYGRVWPWPTPSTHPAKPYFPGSGLAMTSGLSDEEGDLDIQEVSKLPCFRLDPPPGVEIGAAVANQLKRERLYLRTREWLAIRELCDNRKYIYLDECPAYQIVSDLCPEDILGPECRKKIRDKEYMKQNNKKVWNSYIRSILVKTLRSDNRIDERGEPKNRFKGYPF